MSEPVKDPGSSEIHRTAPVPKVLIYSKASSLSSRLLAKGWTLLMYSRSFSGPRPNRFPFTLEGQCSHPKGTPAAPQFLIRMVSPNGLFQSFCFVRVPAILLCGFLPGDPIGWPGSYNILSWPHTVVGLGSGLRCLTFDGDPWLVLSTETMASPVLEVRDTMESHTQTLPS